MSSVVYFFGGVVLVSLLIWSVCGTYLRKVQFRRGFRGARFVSPESIQPYLDTHDSPPPHPPGAESGHHGDHGASGMHHTDITTDHGSADAGSGGFDGGSSDSGGFDGGSSDSGGFDGGSSDSGGGGD